MTDAPKRCGFGPDIVKLLLPHRPPFLMVDRVETFDLEAAELRAGRHISGNEEVFAGHFPGLSVWPGVYTIEGLGQPGNLSPVQRAFMEYTAFGCGYCTPGMIISATALLRSNPRPTRDQIIAALDHHLCRCATYPNIFVAIESLAGSSDEEDR